MLIVSTDHIRRHADGRAKVSRWVLNWVHFHGWGQVGAIDAGGTLWWCWLRELRDNTARVDRAAVDAGTVSPCGRWKVGVGVHRSQRSAGGAPNLWLASIAWVPTDPARHGAVGLNRTFRDAGQPRAVPRARWFGFDDSWNDLCAVTRHERGGFT